MVFFDRVGEWLAVSLSIPFEEPASQDSQNEYKTYTANPVKKVLSMIPSVMQMTDPILSSVVIIFILLAIRDVNLNWFSTTARYNFTWLDS